MNDLEIDLYIAQAIAAADRNATTAQVLDFWYSDRKFLQAFPLLSDIRPFLARLQFLGLQRFPFTNSTLKEARRKCRIARRDTGNPGAGASVR